MKTIGPLSSISAHGAVGKTLIYFNKRGSSFVRAFHQPTEPASSDQLTQRANFRSIITEWNALTDAERAGWQLIDYLLPPLSGYSIFLGRSVLKRKVRMFGNVKFGEAVFGGPSL